MYRTVILPLCLAAACAGAAAQSIAVYQTTPDLVQGLRPLARLHFAKPGAAEAALPTIAVDESQRFQEMDGFGASLTDAAAWLFAKKLSPVQTGRTFRELFSRKEGIALSFLRQPEGSSDLAASFYSFDDLCEQDKRACTTPPGVTDTELKRFSLKHDQEYILPELRQALDIKPDLKVMLSPWSAPGWMKTDGTMLGSVPDEKHPSSLKKEYYPVFAAYLARTVAGYQAAGVPIYALTVQNEPLYAPVNYSGMQMLAAEQAEFLGGYLGPALQAARLTPKVMVYDHNWNRPDYPETVLKDAKAGALAAGTAWHHYEGDPAVMTRNHEEFPLKDQWVTESSGGAWQKGYKGKGNVLAEEAAELIAVTRNWSKAYILWALATDEKHGPYVGGCDTCRGLVTVDLSDAEKPTVRKELDYYVLGHASKFLEAHAVRIGSDEPAGTEVKDVAFRNPDGTVVLYVLNAGAGAQPLKVSFHGKTATTTLPAGSVATLVWKGGK
jgi:glucosylceramidase